MEEKKETQIKNRLRLNITGFLEKESNTEIKNSKEKLLLPLIAGTESIFCKLM